MRKFNGLLLSLFGGGSKPQPIAQTSAKEDAAADKAAALKAEADAKDAARKRRGFAASVLVKNASGTSTLGTAKTSLLGSTAV